MENPRVLVLLADGFEEIEAVTPIDILRRAGCDVLVASPAAGGVTGRSGIELVAELLPDRVDAHQFDLLVLPGGPAVARLREEGRAAALAIDFAEAGKWVSAICAAPLILKDAGLLEGKRFTAHFSTLDELGDALPDERVVADGQIITSRGAGTALDFSLFLVALLCGQPVADRIADSIMS